MQARLLDRLRRGDLVSREAVRLVCLAVAAATLFVALRLVWRAPGLVESDGAPVAHDFSLFHAAGRLAREAGVAAVYDLVRLGAASKALFGEKAFVAIWPYPPPMAALMSWLAALPYAAALALWLFLPLAGLLVWVWRATRSLLSVFLVAGAPVLLLNTFIGQAGPIFALLLAAGVLAAARGSAVGAAPVGLLVLKPHLAVLAPFAFAAAGAWRAIFIAAAVALAILGLSLATQGPAAWLAWLEAMREAARLTAEAGVDSRLPSVQAAARMVGAPASLAVALQVMVALAVIAAIVAVWRRPVAAADKAALLLIGAPLVPPYLWFYDCTTQALAVALLAAQGEEDGFAPWERLLLGALWLAPFVNLVALGPVGVPAMTLAGLAAFAVIARRLLRG